LLLRRGWTAPVKGELVKHLLAVAAVAVVALGLVASCGSDDFGLTAETRSEIDSNWAKQSSIEQEAVCEKLKSPEGKLEAFEALKENLGVGDADLDADLDADEAAAAAEGQAEAEGMVEYLQAKC
jgi:hypothetical protein